MSDVRDESAGGRDCERISCEREAIAELLALLIVRQLRQQTQQVDADDRVNASIDEGEARR